MQNINISLKEVKRNGFEILEASKGLYQISLFFINIFRNLYVRIFINWSMVQNYKPLEIEDKVNITLVIN